VLQEAEKQKLEALAKQQEPSLKGAPKQKGLAKYSSYAPCPQRHFLDDFLPLMGIVYKIGRRHEMAG
jgi:hypothetical protein